MKTPDLLWSSKTGPAPARKGRPRANPIETFEPYLALRAYVLSGKMKPMEEVGLFIRPADVEKMQNLYNGRGRAAGRPLLYPARVIADQLRRALRAAHLESDYTVVKYETDTPGVWFVKVRYEPPRTKG